MTEAGGAMRRRRRRESAECSSPDTRRLNWSDAFACSATCRRPRENSWPPPLASLPCRSRSGSRTIDTNSRRRNKSTAAECTCTLASSTSAALPPPMQQQWQPQAAATAPSAPESCPSFDSGILDYCNTLSLTIFILIVLLSVQSMNLSSITRGRLVCLPIEALTVEPKEETTNRRVKKRRHIALCSSNSRGESKSVRCSGKLSLTQRHLPINSNKTTFLF